MGSLVRRTNAAQARILSVAPVRRPLHRGHPALEVQDRFPGQAVSPDQTTGQSSATAQSLRAKVLTTSYVTTRVRHRTREPGRLGQGLAPVAIRRRRHRRRSFRISR